MKLAAIDLGSNSIHMVIVDVQPSGALRVMDRETEMVRLGAGALATGKLEAPAMDRALQVLTAYRRLAKAHGAEQILAFGTSAIREADNGEEFLERIRKKVGISVQAISGEEEARLIYLAVRQSTHLGDRRALVIDIGGGSLELALGRAHEPEFLVSAKLGALRLTERFLAHDPPTANEVRRLSRHIGKTLAPVAKKLASRPPAVVVGTSGTILALGRLAWMEAHGRPPDSLHHLRVDVAELRGVVHHLTDLRLSARKQVPGLDSRRADIAPAGGMVLMRVLETVHARELVLCEWALREGILIRYVQENRKDVARAIAMPDVRRRSVLDLGQRCHMDVPHVRHVTRLAMQLFDRLRPQHGLGPGERELLEYAVLLHDVGHHISQEEHHKHSYYLIKNGDLRGFDPAEIDIIANVARYHRRGLPKKKHSGFASMSTQDRRTVEKLAGILRLADGLDRTHRQRIESVGATTRGRKLSILCRAAGDAELEIWGAAKRTDLLEQTTGLSVTLTLAKKTRAAAAKRGKRRSASREPRRSASRDARRSASRDTRRSASRGTRRPARRAATARSTVAAKRAQRRSVRGARRR